MTYYVRAGTVPPKRHTRAPNPLGGDLHEELVSSAGFTGPSSLLYHLRPPTGFVRIQPNREAGIDSVPLDIHRRLKLRGNEPEGDYFSGRRLITSNDDMQLSVVSPAEAPERFFRNGMHDELVIISTGTGVLCSAFGELAYGPLDMLYIPRGTTVRWRYEGGPQNALVVETAAPLRPPLRYRDPEGHFIEKAPYYERDLHPPVLVDAVDQVGEFEVAVQIKNATTTCVLQSHPFDVVGWDGNLYPFRMNIADFEPISGLLHQMPDTTAVFETGKLVVCCITPNRREGHPQALPQQPHHTNLDYDEIVYLLRDQNRPDRPLQVATLHPRSMPHGPRASRDDGPRREQTTFYGIMIDTSSPLRVHPAAEQFDDGNYTASWLANAGMDGGR
jgi:homogentisate 1,2-dioxygenase